MSLTRREVGSSNARKYHPNHFEGTIFNLEFCIEHKLSFKQEDRKKTAAYRQGVKKVYSVNTFCGRYQKYVLAMRKEKKKGRNRISQTRNPVWSPARLECNQWRWTTLPRFIVFFILFWCKESLVRRKSLGKTVLL